MIDRKDFVISFLAIFCMIVVMFPRTGSSNVQTAQLPEQGVGYDAWLDQNEDGRINILDIAPVAMAFGAEGDPTRTVSVMHSHYEWVGWSDLAPYEGWGFSNETAGYRQVHIRLKSNATVTAQIRFRVYGSQENVVYVVFSDEFEVTPDAVYKIYDVQGSTLGVFVANLASTAAFISVRLYVTT